MTHTTEFTYTRSPVPTPLGLAIQLGLLEREFAGDIALRSLIESDKPSDLVSHFDHRLPNLFRQGGNTPAIWAKANGSDTRVIGISWTDEYQAIITLPGSGIRTAHDLKDRKVGIPIHQIASDYNRAAALRAFYVALEQAGLGLRDIEVVELPDSAYITVNDIDRPGGWGHARHGYVNEVYALVRGEVDAIYVKDVRGAEITHLLGAHIVFDLGFHPDPYIRISNCAPRPLTVNADTIAQHPDVVERFLRQVVTAGLWAKKNREESLRLIGHETGWSEAWLDKVLGPDFHQNLVITLNQQAIDGLTIAKQFLLEHHFIEQDIDIAVWIDPLPLERAHDNVRRIA
ncbi:ABC-type nitrate/sulfonate/bicarbonate transport system substrate-binding protein [Methylovorus glucosotrophus]|uniref:ABC transporter substrate-binding protein n=1 Tax=Methylovorus glucosotrophus TaxID=266009 RepID=UPI0013312D15|nr:ABC transporter substrate-binding protein [Methylovorus glucosotrophus]KAF0835989.1 ABC-type nitrate/sulfonate/bicarbonate transport system substrate-binding protein [Methylovorus glucosotrophus]